MINFHFIFGLSFVIPADILYNIDFWHLLLPLAIFKIRFELPSLSVVILCFVLLLCQLLVVNYENNINVLAIVSLLLLAFVVQNFEIDDLIRTFRGVVFGGILSFLYCLFELAFFGGRFFYNQDTHSSVRLSSFYAEPNEYSVYLVFFAAVHILLKSVDNGVNSRNARFPLLSKPQYLFFVAQAFTFSRLSILIHGLLFISNISKPVKLNFLFLFWSLLLVAAFLGFSGALQRIVLLFQNGLDDPTVAIRYKSIQAALIGFMETGNYFLGVGVKEIRHFLDPNVFTTSNLFVDIFVEFGFAGILLFVTLITIKGLPLIARRNLLALPIVVLCINGVSYSVLYLPIFWVSLALIGRKDAINFMGARS